VCFKLGNGGSIRKFFVVLTLVLSGTNSPAIGTNAFANYACSESCESCHSTEYTLWRQSHHALAERPLKSNAGQTAFNSTQKIQHGSDTTIARVKDTECEIVTHGLDGKFRPYPVERVIGHDPLIQFLTPFPGGRFQVQEASYDVKSNQWFYVYGDDIRYPGEYGHWTGRGMNWNSQCAECHNTDLQKNYDPATDSYHTTMAEMAVGCEACHGPLKDHNEWQQAHHDMASSDRAVLHLSPSQIVDLCGSCHSRNTDLTGNFKPGDSLYDHYALEILDYDKHWYPDGQVNDEDYEFESFISSKMYQAGVTCLDCHNPHSSKNLLQGNDLCMRCHNGSYPKAPKIDVAEHKHACASDCAGCHMPVTVYMQKDPRRDHGFTIPDPLLTKELGIPNACNRCHVEKTTDWALNYTEQWYGPKMDRPTRERARWIAADENGGPEAETKMIGLLSGTNQPPYWQAVAAAFLEQWANEPEAQMTLLTALKNNQPLVRERAARSLEPAIRNKNVQSALKSMLNDPSRNVREATAWVLRATVDMKSQAGQDLRRMLDLESDQPTGQYEEAMLLLARQQPALALTHLQKAVEWDPLSPPFLCAQAQVQDQLGQLSKALKTLDQAEKVVSDDPHIPYVRATILARNGRYAEARLAATQALKIQPDFQPALQLLHNLAMKNL
jgi:predicted CXXCH cytochrome family protein